MAPHRAPRPAGPGGPAAARPAPAGFPQQPDALPCPARAQARRGTATGAAAPAAAPQPAGMNPYASMKAPQGGFDLRTIDDGAPAAERAQSAAARRCCSRRRWSARRRSCWVAGLGIVSVARSNMNTANHAAVAVKTELDGMQKTLTQIAAVMADSRTRLAKDKKDPGATIRQLIANLEKIKLDPRPNTATIFRVDYFRLARRRRRQAVQLLLRLDRAVRRGREARQEVARPTRNR